MKLCICDADIENYNFCFNLEKNREYEQKLKQIFETINENLTSIKRNRKAVKTVYKTENPLIKSIFQQQLNDKLSDLRKLENINTKALQHIVENLKAQVIDDEILDLVNYLKIYWQKVEFIEELSLNGQVTELESPNGLLVTLQSAIEPKGALLEGLVNILDKRWPCAKHVKDPLSFHRVQLIYFALLTIGNQLCFLLDKLAFLANFYLQQSDISKFNDYLVILKENCKTFKKQHLLLNEKIITFLVFYEDVPSSEEQQPIFEKLKETLNIFESVIKTLHLPVILEQPESIQRKPDFSNSNLKALTEIWKNGTTVSYAIQNEINGTYSKIGDWSRPFYYGNQSNPVLHLGESAQNRLVFRTFGQGKAPELVAFLKAGGPTSFHDIDRDLFNAANNLNEDLAKQEFEVLLKHGANIKATFEDGFSVLHAAAAVGNVSLAKELILANSLVELNLKDSNGYTALHIAAQIGYGDFVQLLIEHQANVYAQTNDGQTALHLAAIKGNVKIVRLLLDHPNGAWSVKDHNGFTPFHYAVCGSPSTLDSYLKSSQFSDNNTLKEGWTSMHSLGLVDSQPNENKFGFINTQSKAGLTALHLAVLNNDTEVTKMLLNHQQTDVNLRTDIAKFTALHFAVLCGNLEIVRLLLTQAQLNVNARAFDGVTALHLAIALRADSIASELLTANEIDVNAKTKSGIRPLHTAAQTNQQSMAAKLIQKLAEIDAQTKLGFTAYDLAAKFGCAETLAALISNKPNIYLDTNDGSSAVMLATFASERNSNVLRQLLVDTTPIDEDFISGGDTFYFLFPQYASLDVFKHFEEVFQPLTTGIDKLGNTLLHYAVNGKNLTVIEYLINEKIFDINSKNNHGQTALHCAAKNGNLKVVEYLLETGADTEAGDQHGRTPIFYALKPENFQILKAILAKGANEAHPDKRNADILHYAASMDDLSLVQYLIEKKRMNPKQRDRAGETAIFYAARKNRLQIVEYLIEKCNINPRHRCHKNRTPLMAAACHNSLLVLKYLAEERGVDVNARDKDKETALHFACHFNFFQTVKYLLMRGANVHAKDSCYRTPVLYAAEFADVEVLKYLVENGANIHDENNYKISALHYAALGGNLTNVRYLIQVHNFDELIKDRLGEIPVCYAARLNNIDVIKYFLEIRKVSPFVRSDNNRTLLHAVYYLDIAKYLVEKHDLDINAIDKHCMTPLDAADNETAIYLKSLGAF